MSNDKNPGDNIRKVFPRKVVDEQTNSTPQALQAEYCKRFAEYSKQYHAAWQRYYQDYYSKYYMAELAKQTEKFSRQLAQVKDQREADGILEQREVQERLRQEVRSAANDQANSLHRVWLELNKRRWFLPACAAVGVALLLLVIQFHEIWLANLVAFISPTSGTTAVIGSGGYGQPLGTDPRLIIPKLNVNAPVVYGLTDLKEPIVQQALQNGVVNYPVTDNARSLPGQNGNTVILGHSSANFFAPGRYKFVFVKLSALEPSDVFYLDYGGKRYVYKVIDKRVVSPSELHQLNLGNNGKYATLVTCDPPGTTAKRLLVIAEQIAIN